MKTVESSGTVVEKDANSVTSRRVNTKRYFHYTMVAHLRKILDSKLLKRELGPEELWEKYKDFLTKSGKSRRDVQYTPVLWFSSNERWENAVVKRPDGRVGLQAQNDFSPVMRIEVNPEVVRLSTWTHYRQNNQEAALELGKVCKEEYNANLYEWVYTSDDIPLTKENFLTFGVYDGKEWTDFTFSIEGMEILADAYEKMKKAS